MRVGSHLSGFWTDLLQPDVCVPDHRVQAIYFLDFFLIAWLCLVLAQLCDQYLVPALEVVCKRLDLSEDVAGVTFLALGGSLPELVIHTLATVEGNEVGMATVVGSALFNLTLGVAVVCLCAPVGVKLAWPPLLRDTVFYFSALLMVILFRSTGRIEWYAAFSMICVYIAYVVFLFATRDFWTKFDPAHDIQVDAAAAQRIISPEEQAQRNAGSGDSGGAVAKICTNCHLPIIKSHSSSNGTHAHTNGTTTFSSSHHVDGQNEEGSGDETSGGERLMNGHHPSDGDGDEDGDGHGDGHGSDEGVCHCPPSDDQPSSSPSTKTTESSTANSDTVIDTSQPPQSKCSRCGSCVWLYGGKLVDVLQWPTGMLFKYTVPDCSEEEWESWYVLALVMSFFYVTLISWAIMWLVQHCSCLLSLDPTLAGLIILAVGASLPDSVTMGVAASKGFGSMSVSGLIGSNVFDILLGLGFPWLLNNMIRGPVSATSHRISLGVKMAVAAVAAGAISLFLTKMTMTKRACILSVLVYIIYLILELADV